MEKLLKKIAPDTVGFKEARKEFLKGIFLFSEFPEEALDEVLTHSRIKEYKKDAVLFMIGDSADHFRIIINGWIKLSRQTRDGHEVILSVLSNGETFGKAAILNKGIYSYTAEAMTDTVVIIIPSDFMLRMAESRTEFNHFLNKFLEDKLAAVNQLGLDAEHLGQMTSAERVGCFLLRLCGKQSEESITLQLPYEKALAAGRLGMAAETFSRSLNQLASMGVETNNSMVTIHNTRQLCAHVCNKCSAIQSECPLGEKIEE